MPWRLLTLQSVSNSNSKQLKKKSTHNQKGQNTMKKAPEIHVIRINNAAFAAIQRQKARNIENGTRTDTGETASELILKGETA